MASEGAVHIQQTTVRSDLENSHHGVFEDGPVLFFRLAKFFFRLFARRNVLVDGYEVSDAVRLEGNRE